MPSPSDGDRPRASDGGHLSPREQAALDGSRVPVHGRDRGLPLAIVLVVMAFVLGIARPWDLLADGPGSSTVPAALIAPGEPGRTDAAVSTPGSGAESPAASGSGRSPDAAGPAPSPGSASPAAPSPVCANPPAWRTAAIMEWAGRRARVWSAADAVAASGPEDPAIPFERLGSSRVEAIGWCAPVRGDDRPPLAATATLFRLRDGVASPVAVDRLAPAAPDALGELWLPRPQSVGRRPAWPPGRYVIRLAAPSGAWARYLGLEVGPRLAASPGSSPSPRPTASSRPRG